MVRHSLARIASHDITVYAREQPATTPVPCCKRVQHDLRVLSTRRLSPKLLPLAAGRRHSQQSAGRLPRKPFPVLLMEAVLGKAFWLTIPLTHAGPCSSTEECVPGSKRVQREHARDGRGRRRGGGGEGVEQGLGTILCMFAFPVIYHK